LVVPAALTVQKCAYFAAVFVRAGARARWRGLLGDLAHDLAARPHAVLFLIITVLQSYSIVLIAEYLRTD